MLLGDLRDQLDDEPDHPSLQRLRPPAYPDDPEADAAYQLLAGEELRTSHRASIDQVIDTLERPILTEDELWSWIQALNAVRLVVGTRLGIEEDDDSQRPRSPADDQERALWAVYDFTSLLQQQGVEALSG